MRQVMTLCLVRNGDRLLLGLKRKGFAQGLWNGFGGKVEEGESIEQAAIRETREEAGIEVRSITKKGVLVFEYKSQTHQMEVHIFEAKEFTGEPKAQEKLIPRWFGIDELPFDSMWPDDRYWMPLFLSGKSFEGVFRFDDDNRIISHELKEVGERVAANLPVRVDLQV